jgi:predicted dehydrogenase
MKRIRFGIIGGGLMGREFASAIARWCHVLDLPFAPEVVAVCSRTSKSFEWFKSSCPALKQTTNDWQQLLENEAVDAIYSAVPHDLHETIYCQALAAGKHLLGEKPFGIDARSNANILSAVRKHPDLVVRCASEFPYFPAVQKILQLILEDRIGRILDVDCGFLHGSDLDPSKPINWKRTAEHNGEYGCMGDLGMHVCHVPLRVGWRPANVRAILSKVFDQRLDSNGNMVPCTTWDNADLLCEVQHDGYSFPLTARMKRIAPGETNTWYLTVHGTRTSARFSTREPRTLWTLPYHQQEAQAWRCEALGYDSLYKTITGRIFEFGFCDAFLQMLAAYCDQVYQGPLARVPFSCATPDEAATTHAIFTAAMQSHQTRSVVEIP